MGCFGSASSKQTDSSSSDDSKSQKRRSDAITRQLQKDKQVNKLIPSSLLHRDAMHQQIHRPHNLGWKKQ